MPVIETGYALEDRLLSAIPSDVRDQRIADATIGSFYAAVRLTSGAVGVAYFEGDVESARPAAYRTVGLPVDDVAEGIRTADMTARSIALAAINALAVGGPDRQVGDVTDFLGLRDDDVLGMVGNFAPIMQRIQGHVAQAYVFDRNDDGSGILPEEQTYKLLPKCSVAILTASSLVNQTITNLFELVSGCRAVAVLGASTPLWQKAFIGTPITLLSGVEFTRPDVVCPIVYGGASVRDLRRFSTKVNVAVSPATKDCL